MPKILFHSGRLYEKCRKTSRAWFPTTGFSFFSLIQNPLGCFRIIAQCFVVIDLVKPPLKARGAWSDVIQIFDVNVKWAAHTHTHTHTHTAVLRHPPGCSVQGRVLVFRNVPRYHFFFYSREFNIFDILMQVVWRKRSCHVFHNFFFKISAFLWNLSNSLLPESLV